MIEIFRKKSGLLVRELYFAPGLVPSNANRDIDIYIQSETNVPGGKPFWTVVTDLALEEDVLLNSMVKNHRYEVKRAAEKDGLIVNVNFTPSSEELASFCLFFNDFAIFRGITGANVAKLEAFRVAGNLTLAAVNSNLSDTPLAMHCYVSDGSRARLYHSATAPRVGVDGALLGRANKLMHWQTILKMKDSGLKIYDFGGISRTKELKGIDDFKRQFGGVEREDYNAVLGVSWLGRLALKATALMTVFSTMRARVNKS